MHRTSYIARGDDEHNNTHLNNSPRDSAATPPHDIYYIGTSQASLAFANSETIINTRATRAHRASRPKRSERLYASEEGVLFVISPNSN